MYPTLFTIGKLTVPTYTVLLDVGLILGLVLTYFEGKRVLHSGERALDLGLWTVIGGIVGGRVGYVVANWSVFGQEPGRMIRIWEGGLSFHGAFLGGLAVLGIFGLLQRRQEDGASFWTLGDVVTPGLGLGLTFGWAACLMGGCAYGALGEGFGYAILPDLFGVEAPRFATQAFGLALALVLFVVFWLMRKRWIFAGASFLLFTSLYFTGQFFLEFTRGDEAIYVGPWRLAQVLDMALALASAAGVLVLWWQAQTRSREVAPGTADEGEEGAGAMAAVPAGEGEEGPGPKAAVPAPDTEVQVEDGSDPGVQDPFPLP
jgi:phosphatidylglycerol:prolipoprotein diacylglycerol transferase